MLLLRMTSHLSESSSSLLRDFNSPNKTAAWHKTAAWNKTAAQQKTAAWPKTAASIRQVLQACGIACVFAWHKTAASMLS
jgi:hypothetical protein